jgi:hypothetical protein
MKRLNQQGIMNALLIPFILLIVFFIGASGFGVWAFMSRQDYKDNSDKKAAVASAKAVEAAQKVDAAKYAEEAKKPLDTYIGPAAYGNITVQYPKTWSGYVEEAPGNSTPISGYFHPSIVPSIRDRNNSFALRVELTQQSYDQALAAFAPYTKTGKVSVAPYHLAKVPSVVGSRVEGQITTTKQGVMIVLPLRNMTLKIWSEANPFKADLDNNILPNFTFVP